MRKSECPLANDDEGRPEQGMGIVGFVGCCHRRQHGAAQRLGTADFRSAGRLLLLWRCDRPSGALAGDMADTTGGYHTAAIEPSWAAGHEPSARIEITFFLIRCGSRRLESVALSLLFIKNLLLVDVGWEVGFYFIGVNQFT